MRLIYYILFVLLYTITVTIMYKTGVFFDNLYYWIGFTLIFMFVTRFVIVVLVNYMLFEYLYKSIYTEFKHRDKIGKFGTGDVFYKKIYDHFSIVCIMDDFNNYAFKSTNETIINSLFLMDLIIPMIRIKANMTWINKLSYEQVFQNEEFFNLFPNTIFRGKASKEVLTKFKDQAYVTEKIRIDNLNKK